MPKRAGTPPSARAPIGSPGESGSTWARRANTCAWLEPLQACPCWPTRSAAEAFRTRRCGPSRAWQCPRRKRGSWRSGVREPRFTSSASYGAGGVSIGSPGAPRASKKKRDAGSGGVGGGGATFHVERIVRGWRRVDRLAEAREVKQQHAARGLHIHQDDDGMFVIRGRLEPEVGALVVKALAAAREKLYP